MNHVICNKCGNNFLPSIEKITDLEIEVEFFRCPACGAAFHVLTTNERARKLIERRKRLTGNINIIMKSGMNREQRRRAIGKAQKELGSVKREQLRLTNELKEIGEKILLEEQKGAENEIQTVISDT